MADVRIPSKLLPKDGRFGAGPSKVPESFVKSLVDAAPGFLGTSHRQPPVKREVARLRHGLRELFSLPDGYEVVIGNGGTTAFWDAAVFGLMSQRAQLASFGEFGAKFAAAAGKAPFLDAPTVVSAEPGSAAFFQPESGIDVYASPHNETSTGVAIPIPQRISDDALMMYDGTSAAAGLPVPMSQTDVYYFAPQKGLASEGGLWIALMSPAALERVERIAGSGRYIPDFFDLTTAVTNSRKDQTYNTPSLTTIFFAAEQVDTLNRAGGLDAAVARCDASATTLYHWAETSPVASPFVSDPKLRSHVVATIDFTEEVDAAKVAQILRANGVVDTEPYRKLGRNQLRIGMYPAVDTEDVAALTGCIDYVVEAL